MDFQDHKFLKVWPLKFPKRWIQNYFVPVSVVKWKKGLDLDLNWNYVGDLQDLYGSGCHILDLEWETDQQDDCLSVKLHDFEQEMSMPTGEIQDVIVADQGEMFVENRSLNDTKFLVDRFMVKRGRSNSNLDQTNYVKKPKIQVNQIAIDQDFKLHHQNVQQVVELECPKFDTENAIKFTYIANSNFFSRRELVALLESKFKIELVERDFEKSDSMIDREDIIVDQNTCIIIHSLIDLLCTDADNIDSVKQTVVGQKLVGLSLRYSNIFILLSEVDLERPDSRVLLR
jgi:hypothetical protein